MKLILTGLLIAGNAMGGWYFTGGKIALGFAIVVASWIGFVILDAFVLKSSAAAEETDVDTPITPDETPIERVVFAVLEKPTSSTRGSDSHVWDSFPDIRDEEAATLEQHATPSRNPAMGLSTKDKTDTQQCLF